MPWHETHYRMSESAYLGSIYGRSRPIARGLRCQEHFIHANRILFETPSLMLRLTCLFGRL